MDEYRVRKSAFFQNRPQNLGEPLPKKDPIPPILNEKHEFLKKTKRICYKKNNEIDLLRLVTYPVFCNKEGVCGGRQQKTASVIIIGW